MANALRKCAWKSCNQRQPAATMIVKGAQAWCNSHHQYQHALDALAKLRARKDRDTKRKARDERRELVIAKRRRRADSLPHQLELTRRVFNTMVRLLDRGKRCPTCGEPLVDGRYDAGHVRTVASCPQLRFDPRNCFGQCRSCNGSGTIRRRAKKTQEVVSEIYKAWILETMGQAHYVWLYGPHPSPNWTPVDLTEMRAVFAAEIRRLEQELEPSRNWRELSQPQPAHEELRLSGRAAEERVA